jgi:hypothetical protein
LPSSPPWAALRRRKATKSLPLGPSIGRSNLAHGGCHGLDFQDKKYERLAIESMVRQIDQQNRAALSRVPQPMSIPGLHH